jgi:hypothetical protein
MKKRWDKKILLKPIFKSGETQPPRFLQLFDQPLDHGEKKLLLFLLGQTVKYRVLRHHSRQTGHVKILGRWVWYPGGQRPLGDFKIANY